MRKFIILGLALSLVLVAAPVRAAEVTTPTLDGVTGECYHSTLGDVGDVSAVWLWADTNSTGTSLWYTLTIRCTDSNGRSATGFASFSGQPMDFDAAVQPQNGKVVFTGLGLPSEVAGSTFFAGGIWMDGAIYANRVTLNGISSDPYTYEYVADNDAERQLIVDYDRRIDRSRQPERKAVLLDELTDLLQNT